MQRYPKRLVADTQHAKILPGYTILVPSYRPGLLTRAADPSIHFSCTESSSERPYRAKAKQLLLSNNDVPMDPGKLTMAGMAKSEYPASSGPILVQRGRLPYGYLTPFMQTPGVHRATIGLLLTLAAAGGWVFAKAPRDLQRGQTLGSIAQRETSIGNFCSDAQPSAKVQTPKRQRLLGCVRIIGLVVLDFVLTIKLP